MRRANRTAAKTAGKLTFGALGAIGLAGMVGLIGCQEDRPQRPPPRLGPPIYRTRPEVRDVYKPLPEPGRGELPPRPFDDPPLISQRIPEAAAFVRAWNEVGHPRIVVFVNRTPTGDIAPATDAGPRVESSRHEVREERFPGGFAREERHVYDNAGGGPGAESTARAIDYAAIEAKLAEWLSAGGQVKLVSPLTARARLTDDQVRKLEAGQPRVLPDVAKELDADVLIQVQARPTDQSGDGPGIRLVAQAVNLAPGKDFGVSLGSVTLTVPPPLSHETINTYTRFASRKLMDDMTAAWLGPPGPQPPDGGQEPGLGPRGGPDTAPGLPGTIPGTGPGIPTTPGLVPGTAPDGLRSDPFPAPPPAGPATAPQGYGPPAADPGRDPGRDLGPGIPPARPSLLDRNPTPDDGPSGVPLAEPGGPR